MSEGGAMVERLVAMGEGMLAALITWAPRVLAGIAAVILVLIVAKVIERVVRGLLERILFDNLMTKAGVTASLEKIGIKVPLSRLLARIVYWLFLFVVVQTAADAFGLEPISAGIGAFLAYLPNLLAAILILQVGLLAGQFAGKAVGNAAQDSGIEFASALGRVVSALIVLVAGIMALAQLKIDTDIVRLVTACTLASLALAFGLSFGLGTREITRNIIAGFYARKVFRMGEEIEIAGERGSLRAITPTQVLLDRDGKTIAVSNSVFLDDVVRQ